MSTEISTNTTPARGLALQTFADAMKFGETVANSEFAPKDFRGKPASCMLAIQAGSEIGLAPLQALQSIAVVNGRPAVFGDAALAVVKASPVCEYVTEAIDGDGEQIVATCTAKRRGYPSATVVKFTVADAKKAGLWGKAGPWTQYPKRMLQMRARGFALRDAFPDVLKGLVTAEEAQDYPVVEPVQAVVVQQQPPNATVEAHIKKPTSTQVADGITVHHVESFEPPTETTEGKARIAISRAKTLAKLDEIRRKLDERAAEGSLTTPVHAELVALCQGKAEMLISAEEREEVAT